MPSETGFVVTRPFPQSNVGSNLASLAGAAWLARQLGRALVVDWRGMSQLRDPETNYFSAFFATPDSLLGIPVLYAPAPDVPAYDEGRPGVAWLQPGEARSLGSGASSTGAVTLVLQSYHG